MRRVVLFMHVSLDGFVARPGGEFDWVLVSEEMFAYALKQTNRSDIALYGRVTYEMMNDYWPTAADKPDATHHDIEHSTWYNNVRKIIASKTMTDEGLQNTTVVSNNLSDEIRKLKKETGKDIVMFGSPSTACSLMEENLIDDYWLFINPILLGQGIPLFKKNTQIVKLNLLESKTFTSGVVCLHYEVKAES
jgi:dihydrofolate reductase